MKCPHCKKSSMGIVGNDDSIFECRYLDCHAEYSINYVQGFWDGYNEASQQAVEANSLCCGNPCFVWEAGVEKCINCGAVTVELSNRLTNS